ncbi:MAG: HIRAN domain-containing protein [Tannerella sp.]|jgi:hypothetical protein|nr:HIRAN domain-containing protein [Tannerella sp.]
MAYFTATPVDYSAFFKELPEIDYTKEGCKTFRIEGLAYSKIQQHELGRFKGCVVAEDDNPHDIYAISVRKNGGRHIGYIPAGNETLYEYIDKEGGVIPAWGAVVRGKSGLKGVVYVKCNINYKIDNEESNTYAEDEGIIF